MSWTRDRTRPQGRSYNDLLDGIVRPVEINSQEFGIEAWRINLLSSACLRTSTMFEYIRAHKNDPHVPFAH